MMRLVVTDPCSIFNMRFTWGLEVNQCLSCSRGFYFECGHEPPVEEASAPLVDAPVEPKKERFTKTGVSVSAGRKRAAELYPLDQTKPCEWRGLANCGGGKFPILGCQNGYQKHRHHGPDKDTLNNEPGNVHRICNRCHNTWHAKNDEHYDHEEFKNSPHSPTEAQPSDKIAWLQAGNKL